MLSYLVERVPSRPLGLTRIGVGLAATARSFIALPLLLSLTELDTLRLPYAEWMPPPSRTLVLVVFAVWVLAAIAFTFGWRIGLSGPALIGAIAATLSLDQQLYANHLYLMAWLVLLLTLADAGAGRYLGRPDRPVVRWPLLLIMAQLSIVYAFSAITKLNSDFMSGSVLAGVLRQGLLPFPESLRTPEFLSIVAALTVFIELFIAVFLWSARLRVIAVALGIGLHLSIVLLMEPIPELLVFAMEMIAVYPLFLTREQRIEEGDAITGGLLESAPRSVERGS